MESGFKSLYLQVNKFIGEVNNYIRKNLDTSTTEESPRSSPQSSPMNSPLMNRPNTPKSTNNK